MTIRVRHREIFAKEFFWADADGDYALASPEIWRLARQRLASAKRVLDLACGPGTLLSNLSADTVVGLDLNENRLTYAKISNRGVDILAADALAQPFRDGIFDMVFATQFIEHVDADRFLREVARVLRPGGTLVIGTVYRTDPRAGAIDPTHIHEYHSLGELAGEMRRHGFTSRLAVLTPVMFSPLDRVFRVLYMFTHSRRLVELPKKRIVSRLRWATRIRVKAAYFLEVIGDSFA